MKAPIPQILALATLCLGLGLSQHAAAQTCLDNPSEDSATCRREQAAADQAEKRGELQSGINYRDNALARCEPLSGSDRDDCIARVQGEGTKRGSVQSGGIYTETRTITIGQPPEAGSSSGTSTGSSDGSSSGSSSGSSR